MYPLYVAAVSGERAALIERSRPRWNLRTKDASRLQFGDARPWREGQIVLNRTPNCLLQTPAVEPIYPFKSGPLDFLQIAPRRPSQVEVLNYSELARCLCDVATLCCHLDRPLFEPGMVRPALRFDLIFQDSNLPDRCVRQEGDGSHKLGAIHSPSQHQSTLHRLNR